jgi:hypothetical protein
MTTLEVVATSTDSAEDTITAALADVQEVWDSAMALFAEMHRDWHKLSRETLGQSLPWPAAEDVAQAA